MNTAILIKEENRALKDILFVLFATFFLGSISKISIPLFFTPIPLVLQNSVSIFLPVIMGRKKSSYSILLYILLGALGFPFYANGSFGISSLFGISGGYIFGYFFSANIVSWLLEKKGVSIPSSLLIGHLSILLFGSLWMSLYVGFQKGLLLGFLPFLFTDILKTIAMSKIYEKINKKIAF